VRKGSILGVCTLWMVVCSNVIGNVANVARIPIGVPLDAIALILCAGITVCAR